MESFTITGIKMAKSYFSRFGEWQNYAHYVLLAALLVGYYSIYGVFTKSLWNMGLELAVALLVADSLVHGLFYILPKPYRWRD